MTDTAQPTTSVIVVTYNRPEHVRLCLEHIDRQTNHPSEVVVVDASPDRTTEAVTRQFAGVKYLRNDLGMGYMATSRAIGVGATTGDVLAFIDDDAYADPDWLEHLLQPYADPAVGAVGGRANNDIEGEEYEGLDQVGLVRGDGTLTGFFAALTPTDVEVDHLIGANMSYRRSALEAIGGIHDHWPGTGLREDADTGLRMREAGYRVIYTPSAVVLHIGGKYAKGRRFDLRYTYYGSRNHVVLLMHAFGRNDSRTRRYSRALATEIGRYLQYSFDSLRDGDRNIYRKARGFANGVSRAGVIVVGATAGLLAGRLVERGRAHSATPGLTRDS